MNHQSSSELQEFHQFVARKVHLGGPSLTPEEVLDEWRTMHPDPTLAEDDAAAIEEAIGDIKQGDLGVSLAEFDREFRARRNLPPKS